MSSESDKPTIDEKNLQKIYEKQVRQLFNYPLKSNNQHLGFIILCILVFAFLRIVGINHAHACKSKICPLVLHIVDFSPMLKYV
jgi:cellobiose-specific phosphotransferase system component IIC